MHVNALFYGIAYIGLKLSFQSDTWATCRHQRVIVIALSELSLLVHRTRAACKEPMLLRRVRIYTSGWLVYCLVGRWLHWGMRSLPVGRIEMVTAYLTRWLGFSWVPQNWAFCACFLFNFCCQTIPNGLTLIRTLTVILTPPLEGNPDHIWRIFRRIVDPKNSLPSS